MSGQEICVELDDLKRSGAGIQALLTRAIECLHESNDLYHWTGIYELFPDNVNIWNSLGIAYYRTADWQAAIEAQEKSIELKPDIGSYSYFFLAMAHWQLADHVQAREWYDRAVAGMEENDPDDEDLKRFRAEADQLMGLKPVPAPQSEPEAPASNP